MVWVPKEERPLAEREGFEPPVPLRVRLISSQVHSTGLCHLSAFGLSDLPSRHAIQRMGTVVGRVTWRRNCAVAGATSALYEDNLSRG